MRVFIHRSAGTAFLLAALLVPAPVMSADDLGPAARVLTEHPVSPADVRARLASIGIPAYVDPDMRSRERWNGVHRFYQGRGHRPAWVSGGRLTRQAETLVRAAVDAEADGIDPTPYLELASEIRGLRRPSATDWADPALDLDLHVTYTLLRYADEMAVGRFDPRGTTMLWALHPSPLDTVAWLTRASEAGLTDDLRNDLAPAHAQYRGLRRERARYRDLARKGGWPEVEGGPILKPGQRSARVAGLYARLAAGGEIGAAAPAAPFPYGAALVAAVQRFQRRHGLKPDGILDQATVAALNVSAAERVRQIEMNLERWRWLPRDLGERYLLVNIPTFELTGYDHGERTIRMRVVTGAAGDTPTPVFTQPMTHVIFSPYWNVPPGIARGEVAPAAGRNRSYLARNNIEVLKGSRVMDPAVVNLGDPSLQFRQRPGAGNSLGRVKFLLPNRYNVYLHDTPSRQLFARVRRDYSHGCVRVQQPFELAQWVLEGSGWTPPHIRAAMHGGREKHVALPRPIPVYVAYFTVWIDDDGHAVFPPDVYRHDVAHEPLLPVARPPADTPPAKIAGTTSTVLAAAATTY
jgi:L,D-transpeptidase YcbB